MAIPTSANDPFSFSLDQLTFNFQLYSAEFDNLKGHWEKGGDGTNSWIDFVFYAGEETEFDLTKINRAVTGFTFEMGKSRDLLPQSKVNVEENNGLLKIDWKEFKIDIQVKPYNAKNRFI